MFKINNRNTRKRCEICLNLTIKTQERLQWRRSGVLINFEHNLHFFSISIVDFEQLIVCPRMTRMSIIVSLSLTLNTYTNLILRCIGCLESQNILKTSNKNTSICPRLFRIDCNVIQISFLLALLCFIG